MTRTPPPSPLIDAAWAAAYDFLADGAWHPQDELVAHVVAAAGVAGRTAHNQLARGSARGWITRRAGRVRIGPRPRTDLATSEIPR